jgi:hypothetical protein
MALSRKAKAEIEEFGEAGGIIQDILVHEKEKEHPNKRVIQDLEALASEYDKRILLAVHGNKEV